MSDVFILLRRSLTIKWKRQLTYCFTKHKAFSYFQSCEILQRPSSKDSKYVKAVLLAGDTVQCATSVITFQTNLLPTYSTLKPKVQDVPKCSEINTEILDVTSL